MLYCGELASYVDSVKLLHFLCSGEMIAEIRLDVGRGEHSDAKLQPGWFLVTADYQLVSSCKAVAGVRR